MVARSREPRSGVAPGGARRLARRTWRAIIGAACLVAAQGAAAQAISAAETLLFQTNHMDNVLGKTRAPMTLTYAYTEQGSAEAGFVDEVTLKVAPAGATGQSVTMQFLSGERQRPSGAAAMVEGNPVLLGFLERDIAEMARLTGGAANFFRKRIRLALADAPQVLPRRVDYAGQVLEGRAVSIAPYRGEIGHAKLAPYLAKRYTFVFSAQVPGGVVQLQAVLDGAAGAPPLMDESLTLVSAVRGQP